MLPAGGQRDVHRPWRMVRRHLHNHTLTSQRRKQKFHRFLRRVFCGLDYVAAHDRERSPPHARSPRAQATRERRFSKGETDQDDRSGLLARGFGWLGATRDLIPARR
jgi:hypothetical protein